MTKNQTKNQTKSQIKSQTGPENIIDGTLLEILVCPLTHGRLEWDAKTGELISKKAKLAFPVRDGIPVLLPEEARPL
ncbi:MAG: Trm112 family protein [Parvibaculales bacterium]